MRDKLTASQAKAAATDLSRQLKPAPARGLAIIVELLDSAGETTVGAIHQRLHPAAEGASANRALERLVKTINDAAAPFNIVLQIEPEKRRGPARRVWFAGPAPIPTARMPAPPPGEQFQEPWGRPLELTGGVALLTWNPHEYQAVRAAFADLGPPHRQSDLVDLLGWINGVPILHAHGLNGQGPVNAAVLTANVITGFKPRALIAVGICAGLDKDNQQIGDVIVATQITDAGNQKLHADGWAENRGRTFAADPRLEQRFRRLADAAHEPSLTIRLGPTLADGKLIDDPHAVGHFRRTAPQAIAYEMEGFAVASTAHDHGVPWIMVKAICDWGDGTKAEDKEARQQRAAGNAARAVRLALTHPTPLYDGPPDPPPPCPRLKDQTPDTHVIPAQARGLALRAEIEPASRGAGAGIPVIDAIMAWIDDNTGPPLFALLGEYGMGKTITCQMVYRRLAAEREDNPTRPAPLLFDLRDLTGLDKAVPTLEELLCECFRRGWNNPPAAAAQNGAAASDYVVAQMATGAVVMFDGLDEALVKLAVADGQRLTAALVGLTDRAHAHDSTGRPPRVLITCRTQYFRSLAEQRAHFLQQDRGGVAAESWRAVELLPFNAAQIAAYFAAALPNEDTARLMTMIRAVHDLEDLASRPYSLKLVTDHVPEIARLRAAGRQVHGVTLYRLMVDGWLARDDGKHVLRPDDKRALARALAAKLWRDRIAGLSARDAENWLHDWIAAAGLRRYQGLNPDLIEQDLRTATFLARDDDAGGRFRFAHTSLQEFFLADHLFEALRHDQPRDWVLPAPSPESFDFLGQMLQAEDQDGAARRRFTAWAAAGSPTIARVMLGYALRAQARDLPCPSLAGLDLAGQDLSDLAVTGLDLARAKFAGAGLRRVLWRGVTLDGADFTAADLAQAVFETCSWRGARLDDADLSGTLLRRCDLTGARAVGAHGARPILLRHDGGLPPGLDGPDLPDLLITAGGPKPPDATLEWVSGGIPGASAVLPDGRRALSADINGSLRLWDLDTGIELRRFTGHVGLVRSCAVLPDGRRALSAGDDRTLRLWDLDTGIELRRFTGHEDWVRSCAALPDGRRALSTGDDRTLRLWDLDTGIELRRFTGHKNWVTSCAALPDGRRALSADIDGSLRLWDLDTGTELRRFTGHEGSVLSCAALPDGRRALSAGIDGSLRLWDLDTGIELRRLTGHERAVTSCAALPDGRRALSAGDDGSLRLWDLDTGIELRRFTGQARAVTSCAALPDGRRALSAGNDFTLRLWDLDTGTELRRFTGHAGSVLSCAALPDGRRALSASGGSLRLWDLDTGTELRRFTGHAGWVQSCAALPDGRRALSAGDDGSLRLWDLDTGIELRRFTGHAGWVQSCAALPDGRRALSASDDRTLRLWDLDTGTELRQFTGHASLVLSCAALPDGRRALSASADGSLRLWDLDTGAELRRFTGHASLVLSCAVLPDGRRALSASGDGSLRLWDLDTGTELRRFTGHKDWVRSCAVLPDGRRALSAGADGTLRLWDLDTGAALRIFGMTRSGGWAAWEPGTHRLLAADGDAWRCLRWRLPGVAGRAGILPLDAVDPPPAA